VQSQFAQNADFCAKQEICKPIPQMQKDANRGAWRLPDLPFFCFVVCGAGALLLIMIGQISQATRTACAV
jgi:hypothetical protein